MSPYRAIRIYVAEDHVVIAQSHGDEYEFPVPQTMGDLAKRLSSLSEKTWITKTDLATVASVAADAIGSRDADPT